MWDWTHLKYLIWTATGAGTLATVALALWLFAEGPRNRAARFFGYAVLATALWGFFELELRMAANAVEARFWVRVMPLGWAWVPWWFFRFALEFTRHPFRQHPLLRVLGLFPLLLVSVNLGTSWLYLEPRQAWWGWAVREGPLWPLATAYFTFVPLLGFGILWRARRRTRSPLRRRQLGIILLGALMPYVPAVAINGALPLYAMMTGQFPPIPSLTFLGAMLMCLIVGFGVVRYQVFALESPGMLDQVFRSLDEALLVVDSEGRIRFYTPALLQIFRLDMDPLGLKWDEVFAYGEPRVNVPSLRWVRCRLNNVERAVIERRNRIFSQNPRRDIGELLVWINAEELLHTALQMEQSIQELTRAARVDALTGAYNRRYLEERLHAVFAEFRKYGRPATLALMDLDNFKMVNDRFGHPVGDALLRACAQRIRGMLPAQAEMFRYGGDECCLLFPNTPITQALPVLYRIWHRFRQEPFPPGIYLHASFGVAMLRAEDASPEGWLRRADAALYEAKRRGGNCIVTAAEVEA